jgi:hypothetical protein
MINVLFIVLISLNMGYFLGKRVGFKDGATSVNYDRYHANEKLQQCLEVLRRK